MSEYNKANIIGMPEYERMSLQPRAFSGKTIAVFTSGGDSQGVLRIYNCKEKLTLQQ